jgi:bifunctional non-homologous end joining protein LigD
MAPLEDYARKRKFSDTPEPAPSPKTKSTNKSPDRELTFCVQRHDASHLHYDFRLEVNGVLVSWAVPKGPSLDPARKPLAMKVEDHPLDYGGFEGNIPAGNYGAGSVMLWDSGTYTVLDGMPPEKQIERGDFKFALHGSKLQGAFALVRMKKGQKGNEWLLIKKPDEFAVPGWNVEEHAWSIKTKRTQEQIAANDPEVSAEELPGAKKAAMPKSIEPMLASLTTEPPPGDEWVHELKWDGVRALCFVRDGKLHIESRRGKSAEQQYPELHNLPSLLDAEAAILDGEIAVLDSDGRTRFELIQPRIGANPANVPSLAEEKPATLFLFDLLYLDGYDLRGVPLEERKHMLERIVRWNDRIRFSQHFEAKAGEVLEAVRKMGMEGIVAKDKRSIYEGGRSRRWLKVKVQNQQEFVIAGFTEGKREHFASLVLGVRDGASLRHTGQVGTGFDAKTEAAIARKLKPIVTDKLPFSPVPKIKDVTWVKPELVAEVRFHEWTHEGMLRAPVFLGLRDDKSPDEVVRETAAAREPEAISPVPKQSRSRAKSKPGSKTGSKTANEQEVAEPEQTKGLDLHGKEATVEIEGKRLKLTNLDKIYYPRDGVTKRDLIQYYADVAEWLIPHLKDRPLSLKRYPNGIDSQFFFQKNASEHFPDWLRTEPVHEGHPPKTNHYVVVDNLASLLYLANLGCIDQNPWLSRIGSLEHPDWVLIDLDPVECPFDRLVEAAQVVKRILNQVGLKGYPKTTGGDGLHVYVPVDPVYSYDQARSFAEILFHLAMEAEPDLFTSPRSVGRRKKGRVYFDWMQIGTGKTIAAPYVLRAHDHAPVSTPLEWNEVKPGLLPTNFTIKNAIARFRKVGDLFAPVLEGGQQLETALKKIG